MDSNIINVLIFSGVFIVIIAVMFVIPICGIISNSQKNEDKNYRENKLKRRKK